MKHARTLVYLSLWLATAGFCMASAPAFANEYADVSALVQAGKLKEALSKADQYLATQPRDPQMRFIKGVIQRDSGKTADAIATFKRLTEEYPELPEPYNNLAVLYAANSQFDKARAALEMAIRTNPSYATAHENLGDIYAKMASQAYNKALQLDASSQAAVAPKLDLIREIFNTTAKAQSPVAAAASASTPPKATASTPVTPPNASAPLAVAAKPATAAAPGAAAVSKAPPTPSGATAPAAATSATAGATTDKAPSDIAATDATDAVEKAVFQWAEAWAARDMPAYLASYGQDFEPPGSKSRSSWEEERRQRIVNKASISVKVDNLTVSVKGSNAVAKFRQDYRAGGLALISYKQLDFAKVGENWLIVKESVGK